MFKLTTLKQKVLESQYAGFCGIFRTYWTTYGGFKAILCSPYFHLSVVFTVLMSEIWSHAGWWEQVLSIMPNVLGFSLGGYAIWLAIGDEKFKSLIAGKDEDEPDDSSPYMDISVAFVHFIFIQFVALVLALLALGASKKWPFPDIDFDLYGFIVTTHGIKVSASFIGFLTFIYALMTALAATFQILRYSIWYDDYQTDNREDEE